MKKILAVMLSVTTLLMSLTLLASAASGKLSANASVYESGTYFTVELSLSDNPGVIALSTQAEYDSAVLKLTDIKNGSVFKSIYMQSQTKDTNPYKIIWMEATAPANITDNGVLATYTFEVLDSAAIGETEIKFTVDDHVTFDKSTADFDSCSLKINVSGTTDTTADETSSNTQSTVSTVDNTQTLEVLKPMPSASADSATQSTASTEGSGTTESTETTSSLESVSSKAEQKPLTEEEKTDRDLSIIITIAGILVAGVAITLIALYFKNKSNKE